MSVTSIVNRHNQQQFNLQAGARAQNAPNNTKSAEALLNSLNSSATPLSEKEHDAAKSLINDYKDAVDLNSSLSKSMENSKDAMRQERIARIEERIKQLKEMLRFASPEQAKRMLKELKQVSKEFSAAAKDLSKAGNNAGTGAPNPAVEASTNIVTSVIDSTFGTSQTNASPLNPTTTAETLSSASVEANATSTATAKGYNASGEPTDPNKPLTAAQQKEELKSDIYAYADRQAEATKAHFDSRIDGMRDEHENLRKISEELKNLAGQLENLADKDDKDTKKTIKDIWNDIKKGVKHLNDRGLHDSLEVGVASRPESSSVSASSISVNVSASNSVSNIVV
ncbi:MAG: hypothetical protein ABJJ37_09840 [Roseibium sp.]